MPQQNLCYKLNENEKPPPPSPAALQWQPSREGYARFLAESKVVYECMEGIVAREPAFESFRGTGLERSAALAEDLAWWEATFGASPEAAPEGSGSTYAEYLEALAERDPPAFLCHFYNQYFAHTAGGRMIGNQMSDKLLDGKDLAFYQWDGDLPAMMAQVKADINRVAEEWSEEQRSTCLEETEKSFKMSGQLLQEIAKP